MADIKFDIVEEIGVLSENAKGWRKEINKILSKANTDGFYYKPRIDMECLLSLTPEETIITTACVASRMFKTEDWEKCIFSLIS